MNEEASLFLLLMQRDAGEADCNVYKRPNDSMSVSSSSAAAAPMFSKHVVYKRRATARRRGDHDAPQVSAAQTYARRAPATRQSSDYPAPAAGVTTTAMMMGACACLRLGQFSLASSRCAETNAASIS